MAYTGADSGLSYGEYSGGREPGTRRKKLAGYLKTANELRQSYFSGDTVRGSHGPEDGPGAFPDVAVVRSGNEEMILFPSYARRHVKSKQPTATTPGRELSEEEFWRREWEKQEDVNAIVDVDVRGWIYTPPKGQHTRKQRLLIGLARQLSGISAPTSNGRPGESSQASATPSRASSPTKQQDEDLINLEAANIIRTGQQEEQYASRGAFSERPSQPKDTDSIYGDAQSDYIMPRGRPGTIGSATSQDSDQAGIASMQKRTSWQAPGKMTSAELAVANTHLMTRLKPFMANPLANAPISAFFYNEQASRQLTVYTDASGHFTFRAALDFIPTHVRVLAGEKLSATEEVAVTSPTGVSLISDIDDTIKHSAISAGAREIFRNAFIRELGDLTIEGVREWYNTLHDMGVKLHYVSNSPWQMYPVLTSYFKLANLPQGSFHLKQYSGMLQGIFEPVAERKKSSLEKIMRDFPDRKFVLVGDSGEADLEVYLETALDHPGRVLGIFIRDVTTTPSKTGYFDPNDSSPGGSKRHSRNHSRHQSGDSLAMSKRLSRPQDIRNDDPELEAAIAASLEDMEEQARHARRSINPDAFSNDSLQSRRGSQGRTGPRLPARQAAQPAEGDLIDFSETAPSSSWLAPPSRTSSARHDLDELVARKKPSPSPPPPPKPQGLRGHPGPPDPAISAIDHAEKTPPPRPRKPSSAVRPSNVPQIQTHQPSPLSQVTRQESTRKPPPPLPTRPRTYREMAKDTLSKARPSYGTQWQGDSSFGQSASRKSSRSRSQPTSPLARPMSSVKSFEDLNLPSSAMNHAPPPPPPRRNVTSYSLTQARQASSNRRSATYDDDSLPGSPGESVSKKEFLWKQRLDRARSILERNGVTLRTWRVGSDVADFCVRLIEMELRKIEREHNSEKDGNHSEKR
ncbi:Phosphatidate phosphatase APP1 [Fulvia fulva]|uniref:Phosphatidate phosphatase APP1 n=1 Tax=Passalora fulva TaxID=5499 RepID=A0A9Q8L6I8_PASFU|nr:Phosphatidate phosphatase APP1 [Fulvia fulva]KAK4637098.1 Phosphatidate phosphatase APP1 [Fulvia fulva]UJO11781.1 Phosphatidate phosphatase APP1 [Fulvia fulva]